MIDKVHIMTAKDLRMALPGILDIILLFDEKILFEYKGKQFIIEPISSEAEAD